MSAEKRRLIVEFCFTDYRSIFVLKKMEDIYSFPESKPTERQQTILTDNIFVFERKPYTERKLDLLLKSLVFFCK